MGGGCPTGSIQRSAMVCPGSCHEQLTFIGRDPFLKWAVFGIPNLEIHGLAAKEDSQG